MATLASPPTLFQAAAAALNPANAAATRDAQDIYRAAVQNVRRKPKYQNLAQDLVDRITNAQSIEELARIAGTEIARDRFWKAATSWRRAGSVVNAFGRFRDSLDLYAQAAGSIVLPVYASVCLVAKIAAEVLGAHDGLHTYLEQISHLHKQYTEYVLGQDFKTPLRNALTRFYETTVEFCLEAFSLLSKGSKATILRIISRSLKNPFENLLTELEEVRKEVDSTVLSEVFHDSKLTKRTLAQPKYVNRITVTTNSTHTHIGVPDLLSQHFVGRSPQLSLIHRHLTSTAIIGPARAAVWGTPGMGKTQLTLRYLKQFRDRYSWNIFINASSKDSIISTYRTIASTLDLLDIALASNDLVTVKVKHWLAENINWLLIFDDVKDANDVLHFTPTTGHGHVLFTTRTKVTATTLAIPEGCVELEPLSQDEAKELALGITFAGRPYSAQDVTAANAVAVFTECLPLAVEQLARLSQLKALSLSETLKIVGRKAEVLRLEHPASLHERNLSCGALLIETLDEVRRKSEGAAALFILMAYFDPSRIPLQIILEAPPEIAALFARQDTYTRGAIRTATTVPQQTASKQRFRLDDYDPFELVTYKKLLGLGQHNNMYSNATLPRVDSEEDRRLQIYWESYKPLKAVFIDKTTINHTLNTLAEAGLIRRLYQSNSLWIHDLYAEMTTDIDQGNGASSRNVTAHLASTMVYLSFPIPQIPAPFRILDECLLLLPSALRCHSFLLEAGTLNDTTTGAELSHLIASTIYARGRMMQEFQPKSIYDAIKFYKLALQGYLRAYNRLKSHPNVSMLQMVLATVSDHSEEDLHRQYHFGAHLNEYQRFGRSAPWRALQTALKLGLLLMEADKLDESLSYVSLGVETAKQIFGASHTETIDALGLLLQVREAREEWQAAYDVALKRAKAFMGWEEKTGKFTGSGLVDSTQGAMLSTQLGNCARRLGRIKEAEYWYEIAVAALAARYGQESPEADAGRKKVADLRSQDGSSDEQRL